MKTKKNIKTVESTILKLRAIREELSLELMNLNSNQIITFLKSKETLHSKSVWNK